MSHPIRVRGLKLVINKVLMIGIFVASYTGAWIETNLKTKCTIGKVVASYTGAWIETTYPSRVSATTPRRILYGCVD